MYLICNFSIKPLACVVFDPDCLKRSYGVNNTGESVDKVVICYVRIMKVIITWKRSSLSKPICRYQLINSLVSGKLVPCVYCIMFLRFFWFNVSYCDLI